MSPDTLTTLLPTGSDAGRASHAAIAEEHDLGMVLLPNPYAARSLMLSVDGTLDVTVTREKDRPYVTVVSEPRDGSKAKVERRQKFALITNDEQRFIVYPARNQTDVMVLVEKDEAR